MVRPTGFEPVAYRLGICRSILLSYGRSKSFGAPGRIRTYNQRIRSPVLYPIELRAPAYPNIVP